MNSNILMVILGLVLLAGLALIAVWHGLFMNIKALKKQQTILQNYFSARHDALPYLVESYRKAATPKVADRLIQERDRARRSKEFLKAIKQEEALETSVKALIKEGGKVEGLEKEMGWLEARTELQNVTEKIGEALERYEQVRGVLAAQSLRFPARLFRGYVKRYL